MTFTSLIHKHLCAGQHYPLSRCVPVCSVSVVEAGFENKVVVATVIDTKMQPPN